MRAAHSKTTSREGFEGFATSFSPGRVRVAKSADDAKDLTHPNKYGVPTKVATVILAAPYPRGASSSALLCRRSNEVRPFLFSICSWLQALG